LTEERLQRLGIFRLPVPVPFPQAGGPVNVYAIRDAGGGLTLFDTGLGSPPARAALWAGLAAHGLRPEEVRRVVVSHGHVDHFGNAQHLVDRAGGAVPVFAHAADIGKISAQGPRWKDRLPHYDACLSRLGVPPDVLQALAQSLGEGFQHAERVREVRALGEGAELEFERFRARVLHMPGHTPGLLCLFAEEQGLFFAADHLLEHVSPNPLIELGPGGEEGWFRPLTAYLSSLARLRELEVELVLPGHAAPFGGHRRVIDGLTAFYQKRQERLLAALGTGPRSGWELTLALFPRARPGDAFLTVSETVANLEVLEDQGRVERSAGEDRPVRFRLAA
jgi:glyoxylase-like metal-dependent hydrolase (beta-lactamase superfamily II)